MDEIYRGYRIAIKLANGNWIAKIWTVKGPVSPLSAKATEEEGNGVCSERARQTIDRYIEYMRRS